MFLHTFHDMEMPSAQLDFCEGLIAMKQKTNISIKI